MFAVQPGGREGRAQVGDREMFDTTREHLKNVRDHGVSAVDRRDTALVNVCGQTRGPFEGLQDLPHAGEVVDHWSQEDDEVVRVDGGPELDFGPEERQELPLAVRFADHSVKNVHDEDKQQRRKGVSLPETSGMVDAPAWPAVDLHPGRGRGEKIGYPISPAVSALIT